MLVFLLISFVLLLGTSLVVSKYNIFSPGVITATIWILCFSLYLILDHNLPPLTGQFLAAISLWVFPLVFSALLMQSVKFSDKFDYKPSQTMMDIYFWISICTFPFVLHFAYTAISLGETGHWAMDLRMAAIGGTKHFTESYDPLFFLLWQVSYLLELFNYSKKNKHRVFILAFIYLFYGGIIMAKLIFLQFFITTICVLYFKKIVSIKHLLFGLGILFFVFISFQSIRHNSANTDKSNFLIMYVVGNMSAFDTLTPCSATHFAENTFRMLYAILYKLHLSPIEPVGVMQPWIQKPLSTNTYTVMYQSFVDFGYFGIGIFALLYGFFFGWLFKKAQKGNIYFVLLFSSFVMYVVMQYVSELFFHGLAGSIKFAILLLLPFLATKYKLFVLKEK